MTSQRVARGGELHRQAGYSLIEVIVAFGVLALALTLLLGTLSGGVRQIRESADAGRAALHAQSLLAALGVDVPLQPGRSRGEFERGRYRWELDIAAYVDPASPALAADAHGLRLLELRLDVSWGEGGERQRWQVRTLRLVPAT